jgi:hypothetical protein
MKDTQCQRILDYLRARKTATNLDIITALWITCPHKRIAEMLGPQEEVYEQDAYGYWRATGERITRERIKRGNAWVTQYRLQKP